MTSTAAGVGPRGWRALTVTGEGHDLGTVPLRPMTLGDLLDEPFVLLRAHLRSIVLFTAAAVVPSQLLQGYLARGALAGFDLSEMMLDPEAASVAMAADGGAGAGAFLVSAGNALLLLPVAVALVSRLATSSVLGERLPDREVARAVVARLPAFAGAWLLSIAAIGLVPGLGALLAVTGSPLIGAALAALGVPLAFAVFVLVAPAPLIAIAEHRGPVASLRRAAALVRPRFWGAAGVLSLALTVSMVVQLAIGAIPSGLAFLVPGDQGWVLASAGSTLAGLIATPYTMLVVVLIYFDARVRREALDVQRLLDPPARGGRG